MGMILLGAKESKNNTFEGNKWMLLSKLDEKTWLEFLSEFNQKAETEATLESFKEDKKAREELLHKMIKLRETEQMSRRPKMMNVKTALL